ncbi:type II toxin-antitoxin system RelB family antitoxin [Enterococcus sp. DIV0756]|uniref:type II toxin-antitoxin system RelB family antitoxin n=1 Tax=Enterococcus sp. DIV0756 TaxID=2774636 RepID=UPI003F22F25F
MPVIPIRVSDDEMELLKEFAKFENVSVSALLRNATSEKLEDQYDITIAEQALKEHQKDPKTTSLKDVMKEYGL